ncbi:MAG TPA: ATP-binding protein [Streptosporangiaceae bacterium]|nr:ATP-binding protein [Streptosporangiaceae bacterium]
MTIEPPAAPDPSCNEELPGAQLTRVLEQPFDVSRLFQLRAAVGAYSADLGVSPGRADDIVFAVHELATNAVRHGPGRGRLRMWRSQRELICEVADGGVPGQAWCRPRITAASDGELPWPVKPGHGLWLVSKVADDVTVRHDERGVTVTLRFVVD